MNVSSMNKLTSCLKMRCSCLTALCEWEGNNEGEARWTAIEDALLQHHLVLFIKAV